MKSVLITGGTQGIGAGIARAFLNQNYSVIICARHPPKSDEFSSCSKEMLQNLHFLSCDLALSTDRARFLSELCKLTKNRLDCLINNAGVAPEERKDLLEMTEDSFDRVMRINLQGPLFLTQAIAKNMIELNSSSEISDYHPSIINITSISSWTSSVTRGEYCISKAGLSMMTKLFADRLSCYNIPVYEIQPGIIETPMTAGVKNKYDTLIKEGLLPLNRWGKPEDIASTALALAEGSFPYCTGQVIHIDGGFHLRRL